MRHNFLSLTLSCSFVLGCLLQIPGSAYATQKSSISAPLSITLSTTSSQPLKVGDPIIVTVTFTNISNSDIPWASRPTGLGYQDARYYLKMKNTEVPKTKLYRMLRGEHQPGDPQVAAGGSSITVELHPGQSVKATFDLNKLYKIGQPGQYTFSAERYDREMKSFIRSNQLILNIAP